MDSLDVFDPLRSCWTDQCLLLLVLLLLHSLCQCDLPHWLLFRLQRLLRPLGLALWMKKASVLSPLLKSTTQHAAQCLRSANARPEKPPVTSAHLAQRALIDLPINQGQLQKGVRAQPGNYALLRLDFITDHYVQTQIGKVFFISLSKSFFLPGIRVNYVWVINIIFLLFLSQRCTHYRKLRAGKAAQTLCSSLRVQPLFRNQYYIYFVVYVYAVCSYNSNLVSYLCPPTLPMFGAFRTALPPRTFLFGLKHS